MESETHREPFVHLVDVTPTRALVAWGAFWFQRSGPDVPWTIVDDERLPDVAAGRRGCVGASAEPYGDTVVEALDDAGQVVASAGTTDRAWVWLEDLAPDTAYRYRVVVDGQEWAAGERWDWVASDRGGYDLLPAGRHYDLRLRTAPDAHDPAPLTFAALGDFGVGICTDSESSRRQRRVAEALEHLVDERGVRLVVGLGDNVYRGEKGRVGDESGGEDDDWYSSFYQPYRYVISRVPFYPALGNHDAADTESSDDRLQMEDNFHTVERFGAEGSGGGSDPAPTDERRSSVGPGLFYRLRHGADVELICIDSSLADADAGVHRFFQDPEHLTWLREAFGPDGPRWRIPFSHHPAYCAGPHHSNDEEILETLVPLFTAGGVRLVLAGHEHNFQLSRVDGLTYVLSGAGGQLRESVPEHFDAARTEAWAMQAHVLLVEIDGDAARLTPISGLRPDGRPHLMTALTPDNEIRYPPFTV